VIDLATYFDYNYLGKGLALYHSLERQCGHDFTLHVLALDEKTFNFLGGRNYRHMTITRLEAFETEALKRVRPSRTWVEYIFTMTAPFVRFTLDRRQLPSVAYVDADMFCFHNLKPLYEEVGDASIAIVPHRFAPAQSWRNLANGKYNVGWTYFKNDDLSRIVLNVWANQCLTWCHQRSENGLFGDQSWLNSWPEQWGAHVVRHLGVDLAPWNQAQYKYHLAGDTVFVEDDPLLIYHFHEFVRHARATYTLTGWQLDDFVKEHIYPPYVEAIEKAEDEINAG
jgi:hypothetical protein